MIFLKVYQLHNKCYLSQRTRSTFKVGPSYFVFLFFCRFCRLLVLRTHFWLSSYFNYVPKIKFSFCSNITFSSTIERPITKKKPEIFIYIYIFVLPYAFCYIFIALFIREMYTICMLIYNERNKKKGETI